MEANTPPRLPPACPQPPTPTPLANTHALPSTCLGIHQTLPSSLAAAIHLFSPSHPPPSHVLKHSNGAWRLSIIQFNRAKWHIALWAFINSAGALADSHAVSFLPAQTHTHTHSLNTLPYDQHGACLCDPSLEGRNWRGGTGVGGGQRWRTDARQKRAIFK